MSLQFNTSHQKQHLEAALELTGTLGFMEDARALAMYRPGAEGEEERLAAIAVFECFRGGRAEAHFGVADGARLTPQMIQGVLMIAFNPKWFNLSQLMARVPAWNSEMIATLVRIGWEIEYRDRASVVGGADAIMLSLSRDAVLRAAAASDTTKQPDQGE